MPTKWKLDADGRLVFTTLAARWDEGRRMFDAQPKWRREPGRGVIVVVQLDSPEPPLEPLAGAGGSIAALQPDKQAVSGTTECT